MLSRFLQVPKKQLVAASRLSRSQPILSPLYSKVFKRHYHYDKDVYGYRTPRPVVMDDYTQAELDNRNQNANLLRLVYAFRSHGHKLANLDPLNLTPPTTVKELDPSRYGIPESEAAYNLEGIIHIGKTSDPSISREKASIQTILKHLKRSYAGRIGFEFSHIPDASERRWFAQLIESYEKKSFSAPEKQYFGSLLSKSEVFDHFMAKKFPQIKRYGLQGAESMMVALDTVFRTSSSAGIQDAIICMPHRGRLNLLTGLLHFPPQLLFHKIRGNSEFPDSVPAEGDVLSHLATSVDLDFGFKHPLHISMIHNPSHLEAANPVALGKARARQMYLYEAGTEQDCYLGDRVICIQLHGDAAFTGQGVVTETLGLSNLPHFTAGGSIHVIVNNQIGYTTPAMNARSSVYTSDVGKMINCPVIHVNGDFPEDVAYATALAFEYRNKFRKDVIIDLITYRRLGHNELDEPAYTQPLMYKEIRSHSTVPSLYETKLLEEGIYSDRSQIDQVRDGYYSELEGHLEASLNYKPVFEPFSKKWSGIIVPTQAVTKLDTGVDVETLKKVGLESIATPDDLHVHPRIKKYHVEHRAGRIQEGEKLDWATAEALAFGTLLLDGYHVRISGQDVGRGTFSQRHAMLVDSETERTIIPLNRMVEKLKSHKRLGRFEIANSSLSEYAVLGFEYGVSWETPNRLCIWEAQFGDFFNGAQIVIDTFLASGETKWMRQSGLVMLLPHGFDGAGPEHSSCRIERFLQLCDHPFDAKSTSKPINPNMHVVNPTTPAQYYHVLRRQMLRNYRKPLIVVGPKVLLRHPLATSSLAEMAPGTTFLPVLSDPAIQNPSTVKSVLFLSGKLYYDLVKERAARGLEQTVALVRVEELSPFPAEDLSAEIAKFQNAHDFTWVQEEPQNQGAYTFVQPRLDSLLPQGKKLEYHGRPTSPTVATGIVSRHKKEHEFVIKGAFRNM